MPWGTGVPDGSPPVRLSMVDRALTLEGWRAVRRRFPPDLKRSLPSTPPPHRGVAAAILGDTLRRRRRKMADEDEPKWRPKIADIAVADGVDRSTVQAWLHGLDYYGREHGRVVIRGLTALRIARQVFAASPPSTMAEAIERLDADLQRRVREPRVPTSAAGAREPLVEAPPYPELGVGSASVDQFAALLAKPDRHSNKDRAILGAMVRDMLPEGAALDPAWLRTGLGQAFWYSAVAAAKKKLSKKKARS